MDPMSILFPVLSVGGMGVVFGACLVVVSPVVVVVHLQSLPVQLL